MKNPIHTTREDRRRFLGVAGAGCLAMWLEPELALDGLEKVGPDTTSGGVLELGLRCASVAGIRSFYEETMGWACTSSGTSLTVAAGGTTVRFEESEGAPVYHVAWTIPSDRFSQAKSWLRRRTPLLRHPDGRDEFHFVSARRRAVYFADPGGNVLELIARDEVGDRGRGEFGLHDIRCVNHVGLVVRDMFGAIEQIENALGLFPTATPLPTFTKLGDRNRHLVLVPEGRPWLPEGSRPAGVFPTEVTLHGAEERTARILDYPYRVRIRQRRGAVEPG